MAQGFQFDAFSSDGFQMGAGVVAAAANLGGDDAFGHKHPGWNRKRSEDKARKERAFTESIRATLKKLTTPATETPPPRETAATVAAVEAKREAAPPVRTTRPRTTLRLDPERTRAVRDRRIADELAALVRAAVARQQMEDDDMAMVAEILPHLI